MKVDHILCRNSGNTVHNIAVVLTPVTLTVSTCRYLQNTTNNVTGAQEDHDKSRYAAYSVKKHVTY